MKQCGGDLRISSTPNAGTTIDLLLPLTPARDVEAGVPGPAVPLEHDHIRRGPLLVVDDDEQVRFALAEMFRSEGYEVIEAEDGAVALRLLDAITPILAVIDFIMPGLNGAEVARRARNKLPTLPIIFVSGYADTLALDEINNVVILRKPVGAALLFAAINSALKPASTA